MITFTSEFVGTIDIFDFFNTSVENDSMSTAVLCFTVYMFMSTH